MKFNYEDRRMVTDKVEVELTFPFYMARHRKYTFTKFDIEYYEPCPGIAPGSIRTVTATVAEHGFNMDPSIEKKHFHVSNNLLPAEFIRFMGEYEHTVTEEEFLNHFNETLTHLK